MNKPNFFIVGAPKCGTTSLYTYLRDHPDIFMPLNKEPHYFAEDLSKSMFPPFMSLEEYLSLFNEDLDVYNSVGEASILYLVSFVALRNIYQFDKKAKIIVMLRNPVDAIHSLHSSLFYCLDENEESIETAWKLQPARSIGSNVPRRCKNPFVLQYKKIYLYSGQIERLFNIFPQNQIKIIMFEDFVNCTRFVYEDVLSFLAVPGDGKTEFTPVNVARVFRFRWIEELIHNTGPLSGLGQVVDTIKKKLKVKNFYFRSIINLKKNARPKPLNLEFRAELVGVFREDILKLSKILNKDLSHWLHSPK